MKELGAEWSGMSESQKSKYFVLANEGMKTSPNFQKIVNTTF